MKEKYKMAKKERLDKILVDKGYFDTKSKAQGAIMAGDVKINDEVITKAGYLFEFKDSTRIEVKTFPGRTENRKSNQGVSYRFKGQNLS